MFSFCLCNNPWCLLDGCLGVVQRRSGHDANCNHGYPAAAYILYRLTYPEIQLFVSCSKGAIVFWICYAKDLFPNIFTFLVKYISLKQIFLYINQYSINSNLVMFVKRPHEKRWIFQLKKGIYIADDGSKIICSLVCK